MSQTEAAVLLQDITNRFGSHTVHEKLNLEIRRGEILALIGGSGTGKSVLLRTIMGLRPQQAGDVFVMGVNLTRSGPEAWEKARRQWGVLFQNGALFSSLTVGENVEAPLRQFTKIAAPLRRKIAAMKVDMVGLPANALAKYPSELSGGMRKRAGLARALAMDPAILLLDEPTAGLDPIGAAAFDDLIKTLRETIGLTVCLVTHDMDTLYAICDRVAVLAEKRIYAVGSIPELLKAEHPWIKEYFLGPRGRAAQITAEANAAGKNG